MHGDELELGDGLAIRAGAPGPAPPAGRWYTARMTEVTKPDLAGRDRLAARTRVARITLAWDDSVVEVYEVRETSPKAVPTQDDMVR